MSTRISEGCSHLLASLSEYPKWPLFPTTSLWNSSVFPGCLYTTVLAAFDQDGHGGLQDFTKNRPQCSSVPIAWLVAKSCMVHATTPLQHWRPGHRTNRESEACRTLKVKRGHLRFLVQPPAQGMAR